MAPFDLVEEQRAIVRAFRESDARRKQVEHTAASDRETKRQRAKDLLSRNQASAKIKLSTDSKAADELISSARRASADGQASLQDVGLLGLWTAASVPSSRVSPVNIGPGDAADALRVHVSSATHHSSSLSSGIQSLSDWRSERGWILTEGLNDRLNRISPGLGSVILVPLILIGIVVAVTVDLALYLVNRVHRRLKRSYETELIDYIQSCAKSLLLACAEAEPPYRHLLSEADQEQRRAAREADRKYQQALRMLDNDLQGALEEAKQTYEVKRDELAARIGAIAAQTGIMAATWSDPMWASWSASEQESVPHLYRIGGITDAGEWNQLNMPALMPMLGDRNFVISYQGTGRGGATLAVQSLLLRLLATMPAGKLRFTLMDPTGLGQNVAAFTRLTDYDEDIVGPRVWTEPAQIEEQLGRITEHMEFVIQKFLQDRYDTIEDYNAEAGEVAEPYRVVVAINFPVNFSEGAVRRLISIATNGPRCGVFTVVAVDTDQKLPHGFQYDHVGKDPAGRVGSPNSSVFGELGRTSTILTWDGRRFIWDDETFKDSTLELDGPPSSQMTDRLLDGIGKAAKDARRVEVPFEQIVPPIENWWNAESANELEIPIGRAGARRIQHLHLGLGTAHHALVAGRIGSGKSTLLHSIVIAVAAKYSPDEVELYLIDFKKGVEFKCYATYRLPHAKVIAIESEREYGLSILQGIAAEMDTRGDNFRTTGVDHIANYRNNTGKSLPRILLVVDEFHEFFAEDDAIGSQASHLLDRIIRLGRAFGIHVILSSQTLAGAHGLARSTVEQIAIRIALQCTEADSRLILADDNGAARLLSRPGEAIYNAANGTVEGNSLFQVAWLADEKRDRYLEQIRAMSEAQGEGSRPSPIVFEGNAPAELEKGASLAQALGASASRSYRKGEAVAWIGEPIAIKQSTAAYFRRRSGSNLLVVGQNEGAAAALSIISLISLATQYSVGSVSFHVIDLSAPDEPTSEVFRSAVSVLPHPVTLAKRRELPKVIERIAIEVTERIDKEGSLDAGGPSLSLYLLIFGLQRARDLREQEEFGFRFPDGSEDPRPSLAEQFLTILRDGPEVGVHSLLWCDTYANLSRTLNRQALREFDMRVVFQMGAEDSSNLIDSSAASRLGPHRALLFGEEDGILEKFRPYSLPSSDWLSWAGQQLTTLVS